MLIEVPGSNPSLPLCGFVLGSPELNSMTALCTQPTGQPHTKLLGTLVSLEYTSIVFAGNFYYFITT